MCLRHSSVLPAALRADFDVVHATRYGNAHNLQYGIPDAFTGNATRAQEHSTYRMDYPWPHQVRHEQFEPLERGVPEAFRSETTHRKFFQVTCRAWLQSARRFLTVATVFLVCFSVG